MWTLIFGLLKALLTGEFKSEWAAYKAREADNVPNKVNSMSDTAVTDGLRKFTKPD